MSRSTPSALDRSLTDALRGEMSNAPMPDGLMRVPDRWVRDRRPLRSWGRAVVAAGVVTLAAATTLAALAFVGALGDRGRSVGSEDPPADVGVPIAELDTEPQLVPAPEGGEPAIGPVVEVARGRVRGMAPFSYTVYRAEEPFETQLGSVCLFFEWPQGVSGGCGAMPGEPGTIGEVFGGGGESHARGAGVVHEYSGLVALHVAEVWIETDTGGQARARLIPLDAAGVDAQLFIAFLPAGVDSNAWVALDAEGTEIGRIPDGDRPLPPAPNGEPTPDPTPDPPPGSPPDR